MIQVKTLIRALALSALTINAMPAWGSEAALPEKIQEGNILHCFNWKLDDVKNELPAIAEAGFTAVQVSPLQGNAGSNAEWFYCYMPYDLHVVSGGMGGKTQLRNLCAEAEKLGIKVIVDVVANHINGSQGHRASKWNNTSLWHSTSFNGINYGSRYSITHDCLGDYPDLNSENSEVQQAAKAYVEELRDCGVKGIRWDAAKHIGLPSEQCNFWPVVTGVSGMYHYGEVLDGPGGNKYDLLKEYTRYITVTDTEYSDWALSEVSKGQVPFGHGSWTPNGVESEKVLYWGESHDTYSNEGGKTKYVNQNVIDRVWALGAARAGETSLYFSRPSATGFRDIRVGVKGSTHFKDREIAAVNHLKNLAVGQPDYYTGSNGVASITRRGVGACIVLASGGNRSVSVANGGSYVPAGTYVDQVSGNTFTVTASTISGTVGAKGIAVIYKGDYIPPVDPIDPTPSDMPDSFYVIGEVNGNTWDPAQGVAMTKSGKCFTADVTVDGYFSFACRLGNPGDWNSFNASGNRYGAAVDSPLSLNTPASVVQIDDPKAFNVPSAVAGKTYTLSVDWSTKQLTVSESTGIDAPVVAGDGGNDAYYTLQGVRVSAAALAPGMYIVVHQSGRAEKVMIR